MCLSTIALSALAAVIVVVDYRRMAACVGRPGRHARKAVDPARIVRLIAAAPGRVRALR
jgi:2-polyprenyl-3-methyl-5-hydroxy-6-metoxy-1,4-benzoquinol methylase